eukprot:c12142_g1_i1.p1 GENE.c12142_g1_i1~~c12142_g1_i1.p1  ORF type:complete len:347 (+),score=68.76 c12142_g1_i1:126-1166(+)
MKLPHRRVHAGSILANQYRFERCLGTGTYSEVWEAVPVDSNQNAKNKIPAGPLAVKIMQVRESGLVRQGELQDVPLHRIATEILALKLAGRHPNIPVLYRVGQSETHTYLVMERADKGDMFERVLKRWEENGSATRAMFESEASYYFAQLLDVVAHLHRNGVSHGDIKLENILLASNTSESTLDKLLLTDFGFAHTRPTPSKARRRSLPTSGQTETETPSPNAWYYSTDRQGTIEYAAPEILTAGTTEMFSGAVRGFDSRKTDAWACGVVLYALLTARLPFDGGSTAQTMANITFAKSSLRFPKDMSTAAKEVILGLLEPDASRRWSVERARQHSFASSHQPQMHG